MIIGITIIANNDFIGDDSSPENKNISLDLDVYDKMIDRRVLYKVNVGEVNMNTIEKKYPKVNFEKTSDVITSRWKFAAWDYVNVVIDMYSPIVEYPPIVHIQFYY